MQVAMSQDPEDLVTGERRCPETMVSTNSEFAHKYTRVPPPVSGMIALSRPRTGACHAVELPAYSIWLSNLTSRYVNRHLLRESGNVRGMPREDRR